MDPANRCVISHPSLHFTPVLNISIHTLLDSINVGVLQEKTISERTVCIRTTCALPYEITLPVKDCLDSFKKQ